MTTDYAAEIAACERVTARATGSGHIFLEVATFNLGEIFHCNARRNARGLKPEWTAAELALWRLVRDLDVRLSWPTIIDLPTEVTA